MVTAASIARLLSIRVMQRSGRGEVTQGSALVCPSIAPLIRGMQGKVWSPQNTYLNFLRLAAARGRATANPETPSSVLTHKTSGDFPWRLPRSGIHHAVTATPRGGRKRNEERGVGLPRRKRRCAHFCWSSFWSKFNPQFSLPIYTSHRFLAVPCSVPSRSTLSIETGEEKCRTAN